MPKSIINQVNHIGWKEFEVMGLVFQNQQKDLLDDLQCGPEFNLEWTINTAVYPDLRAELPGVDVASYDQTLPNEQPEMDYNDPNYDASCENWPAPETSKLQQLEDVAEDVLPNQDIR